MVKIPQDDWFDAPKDEHYNRIIDGIKYKFVEAPPTEEYIVCVEVGYETT